MSRTPTLLSLACLVLCSSVFAEENWPAFRGPSGDGHSSAKGLPTTWSEKENIVWKTAIHGKAWSSPVIWGKQIWMTTAPEDGKKLQAVCVDRDSGKIVHDLEVFDNPKPAFCIPFNSHASSTPVIEEGRLYAHYGSAGTACLDTASGKILWTCRDLPCDHWRAAGSSPVVYKDLLLLTFDGYDHQYVAALDKHTGKIVWKTNRGKYATDNGDLKKAYSTPRVIEMQGKPQMISPAAEATIAYDPLTGGELWRVTHGGMNVSARPLFEHGRLYLTSGYPAGLLAVRADGKGDVTKTHVDWINKKGVPTRPSLLLIGGLIYMTTDQGMASCVDLKTGELVKQQRLGGNFSASPVYAGGQIYFPNQEGTTFVIAANKDMKLLSENKLDEGCMASPAISGKALYLRTRTHLYRIEQK